MKKTDFAKKAVAVVSIVAAVMIIGASVLFLLVSACFGLLKGDVAGAVFRALLYLALRAGGPLVALGIVAVLMLKEAPKDDPPDRGSR